MLVIAEGQKASQYGLIGWKSGVHKMSTFSSFYLQALVKMADLIVQEAKNALLL